MSFLLLFLLYVTSLQANPDSDESKIILGKDAVRHQFPHMVSFQYKKKHACGASIVSPNWAITAAHCCEGSVPSYSIVAGLLDRSETHPDNQRVSIKKIIKHPNYKLPYNDVAMLQLTSPLTFKAGVQPIKLPQVGQGFTGSVWLSGWGRINGNIPHEFPDRLQCVEMDLITVEECNRLNREVNSSFKSKVIDTMVCALPRIPKQSGCHADSGSPLVQNGILVGVVHGGDGECGQKLSKASPNIFTRVSSFIQFIKDSMAANV